MTTSTKLICIPICKAVIQFLQEHSLHSINIFHNLQINIFHDFNHNCHIGRYFNLNHELSNSINLNYVDYIPTILTNNQEINSTLEHRLSRILTNLITNNNNIINRNNAGYNPTILTNNQETNLPLEHRLNRSNNLTINSNNINILILGAPDSKELLKLLEEKLDNKENGVEIHSITTSVPSLKLLFNTICKLFPQLNLNVHKRKIHNNSDEIPMKITKVTEISKTTNLRI